VKTRYEICLIALLVLTGCATTQIAEFRNPEGQVQRCQPDVEKLVMGALFTGTFYSEGPAVSEAVRYRKCKEDAVKAGYVRTPAGQENEETKRMIAEADEARAKSIRK
jgi:hypothetical protein